MILLSELSRRRIRSVNKLLRIGKNEVVMVIRVDKEKGYIDLSKRRVSPEEVVKTEERFNKSKAVHSILRHVSNRIKVPILSLYQRVGWPLTRKYGHAYDAFQLAVAEPDTVFSPLNVSQEEKMEAVEHVRTKMMPTPMKIRADIQVTCYTYEGIEAIRAALLAAQALSTEAIPIKVQLIAPPLYVMFTTTLNKDAGIAALNSAIAKAKESIEAAGGAMVVKMAPQVTSAHEESELARMMEDLEVEGDEEGDEEDNEEGMGSADAFGTGEQDYAAINLPRASAAVAAGKGDEEDSEPAPSRAASAAAPSHKVAAEEEDSGAGAEESGGGGVSFAGKKKKKSVKRSDE